VAVGCAVLGEEVVTSNMAAATSLYHSYCVGKYGEVRIWDAMDAETNQQISTSVPFANSPLVVVVNGQQTTVSPGGNLTVVPSRSKAGPVTLFGPTETFTSVVGTFSTNSFNFTPWTPREAPLHWITRQPMQFLSQFRRLLQHRGRDCLVTLAVAKQR